MLSKRVWVVFILYFFVFFPIVANAMIKVYGKDSIIMWIVLLPLSVAPFVIEGWIMKNFRRKSGS